MLTSSLFNFLSYVGVDEEMISNNLDIYYIVIVAHAFTNEPDFADIQFPSRSIVKFKVHFFVVLYSRQRDLIWPEISVNLQKKY